MVKGKQKEEWITYKEILERTSGGQDIYMAYEGKMEKLMKRPWGTDRHPSFGIFCKDGVWIWKDNAREETGGPIEYVQRKFGLSFGDAIKKVIYDFGWSKQKNPTPVKVVWDKKEEKEDFVPIAFSSKPFSEKHHKYWNVAGVSEQDCKKKECYAVKDLAINRKRFRLGKDEIAFAFYCKEENGVKIYLPEREKGERFYNNVSGNRIWYLSDYKSCDKLMIAKSNKDAIVLSIFDLCVAATQYEGFNCIEANVEKINSVAKEVYIVFGNDPQGWNASYKITNTFNYKYFNIPQPELERNINDPYAYSAEYGRDKLGDLLIKKKIIY